MLVGSSISIDARTTGKRQGVEEYVRHLAVSCALLLLPIIVDIADQRIWREGVESRTPVPIIRLVLIVLQILRIQARDVLPRPLQLRGQPHLLGVFAVRTGILV